MRFTHLFLALASFISVTFGASVVKANALSELYVIDTNVYRFVIVETACYEVEYSYLTWIPVQRFVNNCVLITVEEWRYYLQLEAAADRARREANLAKYCYVPVCRSYAPLSFVVIVYLVGDYAIVYTLPCVFEPRTYVTYIDIYVYPVVYVIDSGRDCCRVGRKFKPEKTATAPAPKVIEADASSKTEDDASKKPAASKDSTPEAKPSEKEENGSEAAADSVGEQGGGNPGGNPTSKATNAGETPTPEAAPGNVGPGNPGNPTPAPGVALDNVAPEANPTPTLEPVPAQAPGNVAPDANPTPAPEPVPAAASAPAPDNVGPGNLGNPGPAPTPEPAPAAAPAPASAAAAPDNGGLANHGNPASNPESPMQVPVAASADHGSQNGQDAGNAQNDQDAGNAQNDQAGKKDQSSAKPPPMKIAAGGPDSKTGQVDEPDEAAQDVTDD